MAQQVAEVKTMDRNGNPRLAHPDVHAAYRDDYDSIEEILGVREGQETRDARKDEYRCDGGDHSFSMVLTDLPRVYQDDLEVGLLLYEPTDLSKGVYEVTGEPFEENRTRYCPTVWHFRRPSGEIGKIRVDRQHVSRIMDSFTFLQPEMVQSTFAE